MTRLLNWRVSWDADLPNRYGFVDSTPGTHAMDELVGPVALAHWGRSGAVRRWGRDLFA